MNKEKKFDDFIYKNFRGLSAHTLVQWLIWYYGQNNYYATTYADNDVYIHIWHVFINGANNADYLIFEGIKQAVNACEWL